jgi:hypothetical protein
MPEKYCISFLGGSLLGVGKLAILEVVRRRARWSEKKGVVLAVERMGRALLAWGRMRRMGGRRADIGAMGSYLCDGQGE